MDRRRFVAAMGSALAAPRALAQQAGRTYRVGVLLGASEPHLKPHVAALRERLAQQGFVAGRNLDLMIRGGTLAAGPDLGAAAIREALEHKPDVLLVFTQSLTRLAREVAGTTPIVFTLVQDAVALGLASDLRRPGGTMTGTSWRGREVHLKRLELLREALPQARRVVFAYIMSAMPAYRSIEADLRDASRRLGLELVDAAATADAAVGERADAMFVFNPLWQLGLRDVVEGMLAAAQARKLPVFFPEPQPVELGGLMSYGPDFVDEVRRAADQVVRILKGARPGELAIDQASRFELVLNRRAARALGIAVPQSLLVRADRVIE